MLYPDHILRMLDFEGFNAKFEELLLEYDTHEQAYDATERIFYSKFRRHRYSCFESFQQFRNRKLRESRSKKT